jgi:enoyl-CoA hydratase/carnithine racemase
MILDIAAEFYVKYLRSEVSPYRASAPLTGDWEHFDFTQSDGIATVTFNRPDKLNALTFEAYADLRDLVAELPHRAEKPSVLIIRGQGRGFCSGGDVEEIIGPLTKLEPHDLLEFTRMTGAVVKALRELPMPVIAAVNGIAAGAGSVIALAADLRILAESASFAFLFTKVGLAGADMGSAYLLPRIVGLGRASELLLLGDKIDAQTAQRIGLATRVVPDDKLQAEAMQLAQRLASGPAFAYATTKSLLTRELDQDLGSAIELEAITQALLMKSEDFAEFYKAWSEGRKPDWKGR